MARPKPKTKRRWKAPTKPRFVGFWLTYMEAAQMLAEANACKQNISQYCRSRLGFEPNRSEQTEESAA